MPSRYLVLGVLCLVAAPLRASEKADTWKVCQELVGTWSAGSDDKTGSGRFTLREELGGKVLVRQNHADIPAARGRPAAKHDDLMVIYRGQAGKPVRAMYWDNEGHTITYTVSVADAGRTLEFVSDPVPQAPRFRLSYKWGDDRDTVRIIFAIAPPGQPERFRTYLEGTVRREKGQDR